MRFRNINDCPRHSSITGGSILPGRCTSNYDGFLKEIKKVLKDHNFEVVLTDEELSLVTKLLDQNKVSSSRDPTKIKGYNDPYGIKAESDRKTEHRRQLDRARAELFELSRKKIIQRQDRVISETGTIVEPKIIEDKPKSLAEIIGHNQAIKEQTNE